MPDNTKLVKSAGKEYKLFLPPHLSQGHDSTAPFWTGGIFHIGEADATSSSSSLNYIIAFEDAVRASWGLLDKNEQLLSIVRQTGELLFEQYARHDRDLLRLAWAQFERPNLRVILHSEVPATPEAFIQLLEANRWFDKLVIERTGSEAEFQTLAANRAFIEANASRSFEAFRRHVQEIARSFNENAQDSPEPQLIHLDHLYTSPVSGSIRLGDQLCAFLFTGPSMAESTKLRLTFSKSDKAETNVDFEPTISDGQIVWKTGEFVETPESLAKYCIRTLLGKSEEPITDLETTLPILNGLHFRNILSFGTTSKYLPLRRLNVFIGPNGSGKSNVLETFGLLNAIAKGEELEYLSSSGGAQEWIWKGSKQEKKQPTASVEVHIKVPNSPEDLLYDLQFGVDKVNWQIRKESISRMSPMFNLTETFFSRERDEARFFRADIPTSLPPGKFDYRRSVLSQFADPSRYPQLWSFNHLFKGFRFYRNTAIGANSPLDHPQYADLPNDALLESFENLGVVLERILTNDDTNKKFNTYLKDFYEDAREITRTVSGGRIELFLRERNWKTPINRLSDGTVKWICLLAILLDPEPAGVVFIEEPEVGLHPDIIPSLAELLREASNNMQIISTTHSDILVDSFTDDPEAIIVCEKEDGATSFKRLSSESLSEFVTDYRLGRIWRSGKIGGNRW
jgi:predicted ATPase